jgi:hypothetical protein
LQFFGKALELAAQLYYDGHVVSRIEQRPFERAVGCDSDFAKWYALLFGYDRVDRRITEFTFPHAEYVSALTRHHDDEVAEYSVWSFYMSRATDLSFVDLKRDEACARKTRIFAVGTIGWLRSCRAAYWRIQTFSSLASSWSQMRSPVKDWRLAWEETMWLPWLTICWNGSL